MKNYYKFSWAMIIALVLIIFTSITYYLESQLKSWMRDIVRTELSDEATLFSNVLTTISSDSSLEFTPQSLDALIKKINRNNSSRVTIIDSSGLVLADSNLTIAEVLNIENHKDRPEFLTATYKVPGESVRFSNSLNQHMLYLAVPFQTEGFDGFIRISRSLDQIDTYTDKLRAIQITVALVGFLFLCTITAYGYRLIKKNNDLQKKKLRKKVKQKTRNLLDIQKFSEMLATCASIDELAELISTTLPVLFPKSTGALSMTHPSMDQNEVIANWGDDWQGEPMFHPNECWGFRKGSPYISDVNSVELKCSHLNTSHQKSSICVPLLAQGVAIGALHIVIEKQCSKDVTNRFITMADHLSLTVSNINLRESLKRQAIRDPLTNLYNRRFLDESLKNELVRAERNSQSLAVLMIDVDHFKKFNDSFGHDAGDYTLQQVGTVLSQLVRGEDIPCRFGGEEFIAILSNISSENLMKRANKILTEVRNIDLTFKGKPLGNITLSIGVASYPTHGTTAEELIKIADTALYQAKINGRNQVVMA